MEMMKESKDLIGEMCRLLKGTLSCYDKATVDSSADGLDRLSALPAFPLSLLAIAQDGDTLGLRIASGTYLKNLLRRYTDRELFSPEIHKEFRNQLAEALLKVDQAVLKVLIEAFRLVITKDFVRENSWTELVPQLKAVIENSNLISGAGYSQWNNLNALTVLQAVTRPFPDEMSSGYKAIVDFDTARDGEIGILTGGATKKTFKFDRTFTPKDDQADVYADASPLVTSVLDGYNVCIFAYGQTGTGKTFTMEGTERKRGVNYRTLEELFKIAEERKETISYDISVSVLEVYNEQIRDLLNSDPSSKKLEIRQAGGEGLHHIPSVVKAKVESTEEVWDVLQAGSNARAVGSNNVNEHSSRSHWLINQSPTFVLD